MTQELSSRWMMSGQLSSALTDLMSLRSVHCVFLYGSLSLAQRWHHGAIAVMIVEKRVSVYGTPRTVLPLLVVLVSVCPLLLPSGVAWYSRVFHSGLEQDLGTEVVFWFHVEFTFT